MEYARCATKCFDNIRMTLQLDCLDHTLIIIYGGDEVALVVPNVLTGIFETWRIIDRLSVGLVGPRGKPMSGVASETVRLAKHDRCELQLCFPANSAI